MAVSDDLLSCLSFKLLRKSWLASDADVFLSQTGNRLKIYILDAAM